jgi:hypothetical protein
LGDGAFAYDLRHFQTVGKFSTCAFYFFALIISLLD